MWVLKFDVDGKERVRMMPRATPQRVASRTVMQALSFEYKVRKCHIFLKSIKRDDYDVGEQYTGGDWDPTP